MTPIVRVYLDANIFIYLFEGNDDRAGRLRSLLLGSQSAERQFFATSELTLAETLVGGYRRADENLISLYDNWTISNSTVEVGPVDRNVLWRSAILRSRYPSLKLPDAIHLATAFAFECSHFLTGDSRLGDSKDFVDTRFWLGNKTATIEIMRPDQPSLDRIRAAI